MNTHFTFKITFLIGIILVLSGFTGGMDHATRPEIDKLNADSDDTSNKDKSHDIRGLYINPATLANDDKVQDHIDFIQSTELNAVVIDVKDDDGKVTYDTEVPLAKELDADQDAPVKDMKKLLNQLEEAGIYTIARLVAFKDPFLAKQKPEYALERKNGETWEDASGTKWMDPFKEDGWDYLGDISEEVASLGFDEIQYDYVRFPENAEQVDQEVKYDKQDREKKTEAILGYLKFANDKLKSHSANVSADVFGLVTSSDDDMGIGQLWEEISPYVDYISPMTYPSHYGDEMYGIDNPDGHPYEIIKKATQDAQERNEVLEDEGETPANIRPWIQDFDLKSDYGPEEVREQIQALNDLGINQYLAWNAGSIYNEEAYK